MRREGRRLALALLLGMAVSITGCGGTEHESRPPDTLRLFDRVYHQGNLPAIDLATGRNKFGKHVPIVVDGEVLSATVTGAPPPTVVLVKTDDDEYLTYALSGAP